MKCVIRNGHQTKFVITYGVIRSAVIATPLRHPSKKVITSGVIATTLRHHNVLCHPASLVKII
jgi:hypothetical protein